jgi:hypothetical protein
MSLICDFQELYRYLIDDFLIQYSTRISKRDFIILKSSGNSYHVVFNRAVSWSRNVHIMCWVAMFSGIESLRKYVWMQDIKESSTLRVGPKGEKPSPRVVYHFGKQDGQIKKYLRERKKINKISKSLKICPLISFSLDAKNF